MKATYHPLTMINKATRDTSLLKQKILSELKKHRYIKELLVILLSMRSVNGLFSQTF